MIITRNFVATTYLLVIVVCTAIQLGMGASILVLSSLAACSLLGMLAFRRQIARPGDLLFFGIALYTGGFAIIVKTLLFQRLDTNLYAGIDSSVILFLGMMSVTAGYLLTDVVRLARGNARGVFPTLTDPNVAGRIALPAFALGLFTQIAHNALRPKIDAVTQYVGEGFGGLGSFSFLIVLGLALQCVIVFSPASSESVKTTKSTVQIAVLFLMLIGVMILSVFGNIKIYIVNALLVLALCVYSYRVRIKISTIFLASIAIAFVLFFISPILHVTRGAASTLGPIERLELALKTMDEIDWDIGTLNAMAEDTQAGYASTYRETGSYFYPSRANLDRFALILPVDQVARLAASTPLPTENWAFRDIAETALPSFLISKTGIASADYIAWYYGIRPPGIIGRPVIGMTASALAEYGIAGVLLIPAVLTFLSFSLWNWLAGTMALNGWAAFLTAYLSFMVEKEIGPYIAVHLRDLPIVIGVTGVLCWYATRRAAKNAKWSAA